MRRNSQLTDHQVVQDAHDLCLDRPKLELMAVAANVMVVGGGVKGVGLLHSRRPAESGLRLETVAFFALCTRSGLRIVRVSRDPKKQA